ncbi:helix-turn-helix domain-containing protein [Dryocola sp. LX212]|jgi:CRP-like cAMP-binding protein
MPDLFSMTEHIYAQTDFSCLKESIMQKGREITFPAGAILRPKEDEILILTSGQMTMSNSSSEGLMIGQIFTFMPIGLLERHYQLPLYYQAESEVTIFQLTTKEFKEIFYEVPENAELLSQILTYMSSMLIHIYYERNNDSGYATVRQMLHRYMYRMEESAQFNEGIASFILKRTRLSRSYVFQILSALKSGGYITIKNARLVAINRDIPKRF